jgi:type IV secretory pathway VirB3-like protein
MKLRYELEQDPLAVGLTKPAMKLGVPFAPFYLSILGCLFGWMFYQALSGNTGILSTVGFLVLWGVVYLAMLWATFNDPFGLSISWANFLHFRKHATHSFWSNTDSYAP